MSTKRAAKIASCETCICVFRRRTLQKLSVRQYVKFFQMLLVHFSVPLQRPTRDTWQTIFDFYRGVTPSLYVRPRSLIICYRPVGTLSGKVLEAGQLPGWKIFRERYGEIY